jgi:hypothetical protein
VEDAAATEARAATRAAAPAQTSGRFGSAVWLLTFANSTAVQLIRASVSQFCRW